MLCPPCCSCHLLLVSHRFRLSAFEWSPTRTIKPMCTAAWTWLLTVFEGGLGLIRIIKKGVTWERKRNPLTMAYNPGFCGQARRGGAGEKGSDFILCGVVLFHKETCRPPGPYRATPKPLLRDTTSLVLFWPLHSLCALSSPTRDQTRAPAVNMQNPNHWTSRGFPKCAFYFEN